MNKRKEQGLIITLLTIISGVFVFYFSTSTSPICKGYYGDDSAMFQVIGKSWTQGLIPYIHTFDHKGPFIFFVNAVGYGMGNYGLLFLQWIFMILSFWGIYKIATLFGNFKYRLLCIAGSYLTLAIAYGTGNYTEEYSLLFLVFSLYFALVYFLNRKENPCHNPAYALWYGVTFSVIFLMRVTSAFMVCVIVLFVLICLIQKKAWGNILKNAVAFLTGFALVLLPFCIYFAMQGALGDFIYGTIIHNVLYAEKSTIFIELGASWSSALCAILIIVILAFTALLYLLQAEKQEKVLPLFSLFLALGTICMFARMNRYLHYYMIAMPYFSLALGMTKKIYENANGVFWKKITLYLCVGMMCLETLIGGFKVVKHKRILTLNKKFATEFQNSCDNIMNQVPKEERGQVLVFGSNALSQWYLSADLKPIYKYCFLQDWMSSCSKTIENEVSAYLKAGTCKWLVVDGDYETEEMQETRCKEFKELIEEKYKLVAVEKVETDYKCILLYHLKSTEE